MQVRRHALITYRHSSSGGVALHALPSQAMYWLSLPVEQVGATNGTRLTVVNTTLLVLYAATGG